MANMQLIAAVAVATICLIAPAIALPASFNHGVASGDPLPDRMIIWSRITPRNLTQTTYAVKYQVSQDKSFKDASTKKGVVYTSDAKDFTVKTDVKGLTPGKQYYFQWYVDDGKTPKTIVFSPIGMFRTPYPAGVNKQKKLRYAVFSCSNWGWGFFNAYDAASKLDLDFWVHLGDYYYEYGIMSYPSPDKAVRYQEAPLGLQPHDEIIHLEDYQARHALYRQDPGLQALSAKAALIAMWDDHEVTNNARKNSAQNHQPATEGDYQERKRVSILAYHQWMPTRDHSMLTGEYVGINYNRTYSFGELATFIMTETRLTARSDEKTPDIAARVGKIVGGKNPDQWTASDKAALVKLKAEGEALAKDPNYRMLGDNQIAWMEAETKASVAKGVHWQLYGYGTVMLDSYYPDFNRAIEVKKKTDAATANKWEAAFKAVAYDNGMAMTTKSYGQSCYNLPYYGQTLPVTPDMRASIRTQQALAEYLITNYYDSWPGFLYEKEKVLRIASMANNAAQYGGDSHADWMGVQKYEGKAVIGEFDCGGVTSPSYEDGAFLPMDFLNEAMTQGGYDTGLRRAYAGKKGFFYVELDAKVHHTEYIHMSQCTQSYEATCDFAYDWFAKPYNKGDLVPSECKSGKIVSGPDYAVSHKYNKYYPFIGQQASAIP